jgi:hypothetical protein
MDRPVASELWHNDSDVRSRPLADCLRTAPRAPGASRGRDHPRRVDHAAAAGRAGCAGGVAARERAGAVRPWDFVDALELDHLDRARAASRCRHSRTRSRGWRRSRMPELPDVAPFEFAPDWVCEVVSPSTAAIDRVEKLPRYAAAGVAYRGSWIRSLGRSRCCGSSAGYGCSSVRITATPSCGLSRSMRSRSSSECSGRADRGASRC